MSRYRMSRIESVVRTVLAFYEAFNRYDIPGMMKLVSSDCIFESAGGLDGKVFTGKEEINLYWQRYIRERPKIQIDGEDIFGLGNRCVMRWRAEWKDSEGQDRHVRAVDIFQLRDGLIWKQYSYVKG